MVLSTGCGNTTQYCLHKYDYIRKCPYLGEEVDCLFRTITSYHCSGNDWLKGGAFKAISRHDSITKLMLAMSALVFAWSLVEITFFTVMIYADLLTVNMISRCDNITGFMTLMISVTISFSTMSADNYGDYLNVFCMVVSLSIILSDITRITSRQNDIAVSTLAMVTLIVPAVQFSWTDINNATNIVQVAYLTSQIIVVFFVVLQHPVLNKKYFNRQMETNSSNSNKKSDVLNAALSILNIVVASLNVWGCKLRCCSNTHRSTTSAILTLCSSITHMLFYASFFR